MTTWIIVGLILTAIFIYGLFIEPRWLVFSRRTVKVTKRLARPLKILHLSDIHFHPQNGHVISFFNELEKISDVDLIFITGDIVDNDNGIEIAKEQLKRLHARHGIYVVLGNHDHYWYGLREVFNLFFRRILPRFKNDELHLKRVLEETGCLVLLNEARTISIDGHEIYIAGLDDPVTGQDRPEKLIRPQGTGELRILLTHLLDAFHKVEDFNFDLVFSGHTHGGQIRIPFYGPLFTHSKLHRKFASGLHRISDTHVFTSRGIGTSPILPSRFFCHPEAIIFTIESSQSI